MKEDTKTKIKAIGVLSIFPIIWSLILLDKYAGVDEAGNVVYTAIVCWCIISSLAAVGTADKKAKIRRGSVWIKTITSLLAITTLVLVVVGKIFIAALLLACTIWPWTVLTEGVLEDNEESKNE